MKSSVNKVLKKIVRATEKRAWKRGDSPTHAKMAGRFARGVHEFYWS